MTHQEIFQLVSFIALFLLLVVCAYTDITRNKVYNWCTLPAMGLGLALAYLGGGVRAEPGFNLVTSGAGLALGGGIFLLFCLFGGIGFGDVKLMGAVGALGGFPFVLSSLLYSSMVGFLIAAGLLIWRGRLKEGLLRSAKFAFRWRREKKALQEADGEKDGARRAPDTIPFGAAIAFGTMWAFVLSVPAR